MEETGRALPGGLSDQEEAEGIIEPHGSTLVPEPVVMLGDRVDSVEVALLLPQMSSETEGGTERVVTSEMIRCTVCGDEFVSSSKLLEHLHVHSQNELGAETGDTGNQTELYTSSNFNCNDCNRSFRVKRHFDHHVCFGFVDKVTTGGKRKAATGADGVPVKKEKFPDCVNEFPTESSLKEHALQVHHTNIEDAETNNTENLEFDDGCENAQTQMETTKTYIEDVDAGSAVIRYENEVDENNCEESLVSVAAETTGIYTENTSSIVSMTDATRAMADGNSTSLAIKQGGESENLVEIIESCIHETSGTEGAISIIERTEVEGDETVPKKKSLKNILKGRTMYQCVVCNKSFDKKSLLERHMKSHHPEFTECDDCGEEIVKKPNLVACAQRDHRDEFYQCSLCSESYVTKAELQRHKKVHKEQPTVHCNQCDATFVYKKDLKIHVRKIHKETPRLTNETPMVISDYVVTDEGKAAWVFRCNLCARAFTLKTDLLRHFLIHSGEKPFSCDICDSRFNRKSNLLRHRRLMHNIMDRSEPPLHKRDFRQKRFQYREVWEIESDALAEEERIIREEELLRKAHERDMQISEWMKQHTVEEYEGDEDYIVQDEYEDYDDITVTVEDGDDDEIPKSGVELSMLKPDEKITVRILTFDS